MKLSPNCGSAPEQNSSDSRSTGDLHSGVSFMRAILFLVALFPQFLHTDYPLWSQTLILGLTCVLVDCLVMVGYALVASPLAQLVTNERRMRLQNRLFGSLFMAAGAALASSSR